jgi:class 3 adenylate cyclase/tetratricopeptide (TPR) repeat protein
VVICPNCGEENPDRFRLCGFCGTPLTAPSPGRETRKLVTIVFSDLVESTKLADELDTEILREVLARYFEEMRLVLDAHGGTVEKYIGDAIMAVFGLPTVHEDDALRAVRAAGEMQAALTGLNDELERRWGVRLAHRTGVNTGEVVAGDVTAGQRLTTGDAVNVAARLEQAASPLEVLIGESTLRLVRDAVDVEPVGSLELKGKPEPMPAYRLVGVREQASRPEPAGRPLVGRDPELALLAAELDQAISAGTCRLVTVLGNAGLGKSSLTHEFADAAAGRARTIGGRCLQYGRGITFWPLIEAVRQAAAIGADDPPDVARSRIAACLPGADDAVERVASAIGLSDRQFAVEELFWGVRKLFEALARERPLIVLFEDIHWAEATFLDLVERVAESLQAPVLLLCAARPELDELRPHWGAGANGVRVELRALSDDESAQLLEGLLGSIAEDVRARIVEAAEGNPLYAEQLLSMLVDDGLVRREGGSWVAAGELGTLALPPTIQALLAARLDLLTDDERTVIEAASVVGYVFAQDALAEVAPEELRAGIPGVLAALAQKRFVHPELSGLIDAHAFRFDHLLIRDAAYNGILKRTRAALHERFVTWAERVNRDRDRETEYEEILGYHLEQAHGYLTDLGTQDDHVRELGVRAATLLASAGRRAFGRGDMPAAANLLRRAAALLPEDDEKRLALLPPLGEAFMETGEFPWAEVYLEEAVEQALQRGHAGLHRDAVLTRLLVSHHVTDDLAGWRNQVVQEVELILPEAERELDHAVLAKAWRLLAFVHGSICHWGEAVAADERALEHARLAGDARLQARLSAAITMGLCDGPTPAGEAIERCEEIAGEGLADRQAEALVLCSLAYLRSMQGDFTEARELYGRARDLLRDLGGAVLAASTSLASARVELLAGEPARAEGELARDYEALDALGERYFLPLIAAHLAEAVQAQGRDEEATRLAATARELADEDDVEAQALWRRVHATALANEGRLDEAERLARESVEVLAPTDALVMKADALVGLADVLLTSEPERREALAEAQGLYELKGNVVAAARVRGLLDDLVPGAADAS